MLCDRCKKIISQFEKDYQKGKETVESLIKCKECSQEIIGRCHTCHWPIYRTELIYESSFNSSSRGNFWIWIIKSVFRIDDIQTVIQCEWCYKQWQTELKKQQEELEKRDQKLSVLFSFLVFFLLIFFWWDFMEKAFNYPPVLNLFITIIACFFLGFFIVKTIEKVPKAKKYKDRKYRNKEENKEIKLKTPFEPH